MPIQAQAATPLPVDLPVIAPGREHDGAGAWAPVPAREAMAQLWVPGFNLAQTGHCDHLRTETRKISLPLLLYLSNKSLKFKNKLLASNQNSVLLA